MVAAGVAFSIFGDYELLRLIEETEARQTFEAKQLSVGRRVLLVVLQVEPSDGASRSAFQAEARAKASVNHPRIAPVYECGEESGLVFYAGEWLEGETIAQARAAGRVFPYGKVLEIVRVVGEIFLYYEANEIAHHALTDESIVLVDGEPFLVNLAAVSGEAASYEKSMATLRRVLSGLLAPHEIGQADMANFLTRMDATHPKFYRSWHEVLRVCNIARSMVGRVPTVNPRRGVPPGARRATWPKWLGLLALGALSVYGIWRWQSRPQGRLLDELVEIPAGDFIFQEDQKKELPTFWISRYEVTIADYALFLVEVERRGMEAFRHPRQPTSKLSYLPQDWSNYYEQAKKRGHYLGNRIDLDCPVFGVDWWDAQAYANWKGRRLPTSEEWEKAARGTHGQKYPWGDEDSPSRFNSGMDAHQEASQGGQIDGYNAWAPVDAFPEDRSAFGVVGMAGNVSEWTSSMGPHQNDPDRFVPIVRGASFRTNDGLELSRVRQREPDSAALFLGFRTAKDG